TVLVTGPRVGQVLLAGGGGNWPDLRESSEFFDPASGTFQLAPGFAEPRLDHTATLLGDGRIAFIGGTTNWVDYNQKTSSVEIYDPVTNTFSSGGDLLVERSQHVTSPVQGPGGGPNDLKLIVVGGYSASTMSSRTVELFDPASTALRVVTATLPDGNVGTPYSGAMQATGGTGAGYQFSVSGGSLPPGVSMDQNGTLSGTPTSGGVWPVVIQVMDSASNAASRAFTIYIDRLAITTASFANADEGVGYTQILAATGVGAITWSLEPGNSLPPGLTLDNGLPAVTGIPTVAGWYFFTLRATDAVGQTATRGYSLQVVAPLSIDAASFSLGVTTENHDFNFTLQKWIGDVTWRLGGGSRPPGLGVSGNGHTGWVAGLPHRTGTS
ncbi:MAG: putative Ig domain-containing protein, partial [Vicinamibacterales bacterium]